jgi:hypothetical protein
LRCRLEELMVSFLTFMVDCRWIIWIIWRDVNWIVLKPSSLVTL